MTHWWIDDSTGHVVIFSSLLKTEFLIRIILLKILKCVG